MPDDAECLRLYAETHDQDAFSEFVRRHVDLVYAAAYRQTGGDRHLAEDVAQTVFVTASRKAGRLSSHPAVAAWLHQATRYAAIDVLRSRRRRQAREEAVSRMEETLAAPEPAPDWEELSPRIDELVSSLGERDRTAVVLRFFSGKSYADIGAQLGVGEDAARMRVERALEKLRRRLTGKGAASSGAALATVLAQKGVMAAPSGLGAACVASALAAPALGGVAIALGTFKIMSAAKIIAGVATGVALLSIVAAVHEHQAAVAAEQSLERQAVRARMEAHHPEAAPAAAPGEGVGGAGSHPAEASGSGSAPAGAGAPSGGADSAFGALLRLLGNPAFQKQTMITAKIRLDQQYGALFKNLNLPPAQLDQFKNLLVEKAMVGFDSMAAAHDQGIDPKTDARAFFQTVAGAEKNVDSEIAAILGADGFGQFQQYQQTIPGRNTANLLREALSYTATPLTDDQAASVMQIAAASGIPALPPTNPFAVLNSDLGVIGLKDEGLARLQGVLSAPQLEVLQEKVAQQNQLLIARRNMGH